MIAEIYHKQRSFSEDELTGCFFGTMRYIPFQRGLQTIFLKYVKSDDRELKLILEKICVEDYDVEFWKRSEIGLGEIDGLIKADEVGIGIEVKYGSGLSGDEQLEREALMLKEWCGDNPKILLLVAKEEEAKGIYLSNYKKSVFKNVHLGYLTWQDILLGLNEVDTVNVFEEKMISDLKSFLKEKGFVSFHGFETDIPVVKELFYDFR